MLEPANHSVLVVDDHGPTRYAIARALRAAGFRTVEASAGAQALELAPYVSAVVLDVHLPDLHGLEVCRLLRKNPVTAALPVVQISAVYLDEEDKEAAHQAGADVYLTGPVDFGDLTDTLRELLQARSADLQ
jgi:CheY-like chemotaxis protein